MSVLEGVSAIPTMFVLKREGALNSISVLKEGVAVMTMS